MVCNLKVTLTFKMRHVGDAHLGKYRDENFPLIHLCDKGMKVEEEERRRERYYGNVSITVAYKGFDIDS